jgi:dimethylglycine dehydrogenase
LRRSTIHDRLKAKGAQFQQIFGWERARWFDSSGKGESYSFRRSNWFEAVRAEALAVREQVGLMDLSTFAKFEVTGPDARHFLDRICANRIPARPGGIVLTHLLNANGFIESELTVTRLGLDRFYILSAAVAQLHDRDQLEWRKRADEQVHISDVTDANGCLVFAGPRARDVLKAVTDADLSNASFPWLTGKEIAIAGVDGVRALRVNYVGELGWELHVPMPALPQVFDALIAAGAPHGLKLFGTYAMNSLRMEKAYRAWGGELTNEIDMFEASMERFIRLDKEDFVGRDASLRRQQRGPRMKLVYLEIDTTDNDPRGNEPVYHEGKLVGITTGGAYGFAVRKTLAFAYVDPALTAEGTEFEIPLLGDTRRAQIIAQPAWDPENKRLKA